MQTLTSKGELSILLTQLTKQKKNLAVLDYVQQTYTNGLDIRIALETLQEYNFESEKPKNTKGDEVLGDADKLIKEAEVKNNTNYT